MTKKADTTKTVDDYASKATAKRGAKRKFGDNWEKHYTVEQAGDRWVVKPIPEPEPEPESPATTTGKCPHKNQIDYACPECEAHIGKKCSACGKVRLYKKGHPHLETCSKFVKPIPIKRVSDIESPCQFVWNMADEMFKKGARRKDIIAACVQAGIAYYTARTQYQLWFKAKNA
jgi:hypothetical protein